MPYIILTAHFLKSVCFDCGQVASRQTLLMNTFSSNQGTNTRPLEGLFLPLVSTLALTLPLLDSTQQRTTLF